jgi:D-amino peptidase
VRVLVSADMEGVSGVVHPDDVEPGTAPYAEFRHVMTADVNAAVDGLFAAGATAVIVNDSHYTMRNLVVAELDPRVTYIRGSQKPLGMLEGLLGPDGSPAVDALAFVGYHAGAGQPGVLAHTHLAGGVVEVRFDGTPMSEGRMNALTAASVGVPLVLITGDDVTCADAAQYAPAAAGAEVKRAITRYTAEVLPFPVARQVIRGAAESGLRDRREPVAPTAPFEIEIDVDAAHLAVAAARVPGVDQVGLRTVRAGGPSMLEAYLTFRLATVMIGSAMVGDWG